MFKQLKSIIYKFMNFIKSKLKKQTKNNENIDNQIKVVSCKVRYIKTEKTN